MYKREGSRHFRESHERLSTEEPSVMEELGKSCSEAEEGLQKALDSLREAREYNAILSAVSYKTEGREAG